MFWFALAVGCLLPICAATSYKKGFDNGFKVAGEKIIYDYILDFVIKSFEQTWIDGKCYFILDVDKYYLEKENTK